MKHRIGKVKNKIVVEGGETNTLKNNEVLVEGNNIKIKENNQIKNLGSSSSNKLRYFIMPMTNEENLIRFGIFSSFPNCSIVNNKVCHSEYISSISSIPQVSNIMISDKYNGSETIWEAIKTNHDGKLPYKTLDEAIIYSKNNGYSPSNLPIEISEEDALNPNNYELQEDGTYKYIKI